MNYSLHTYMVVHDRQRSAVCACCRSYAVALVFALVVLCMIMMLFVNSRVGKNRDTRRGSPAGAGAGRGASHKNRLFNYSIVAPRSGNCIYRPVVWSLFFYFLLSPKMSFRSCISLLSRLSNFFLFNSSSISFLLYSSINM